MSAPRALISPRLVIVVMVVLLGGGLAVGAGSLLRVWAMQRELEGLEHDIAQLRVETRKLAESVEHLRSDPVYLEKAAREELGWVRKGDTVLKFTPTR